VLYPRALRAVPTIILLSVGCASSAPPPAEETPQAAIPPAPASAAAGVRDDPPARDAASYSFDGFKLGSLYGSAVMTRPPYDRPCDNDAIDHKARRFMVYGALPCRDLTFLEETTAAFYIRYAEGPDQYNQPIAAFAWLGGGYFSTRSDFPVRTGQPASAAAEVLGAPEKSFDVERKDRRVTVQRHPGTVYSIVDSGILVGFVAGPMPDDPENEQWRGLMQMYVRYTKPPPAASTAAPRPDVGVPPPAGPP
jgi:hypothetical protein